MTDPAFAYQRHQDHLEREAQSATYHLSVNETFEVEVDSLKYQVEVDCTVDRNGEHGDLVIGDVYFAYKAIHVGLPQFGNMVQLVEENLRQDHRIIWSLLEAAVDFEILKFASKSDRWEMG